MNLYGNGQRNQVYSFLRSSFIPTLLSFEENEADQNIEHMTNININGLRATFSTHQTRRHIMRNEIPEDNWNASRNLSKDELLTPLVFTMSTVKEQLKEVCSAS